MKNDQDTDRFTARRLVDKALDAVNPTLTRIANELKLLDLRLGKDGCLLAALATSALVRETVEQLRLELDAVENAAQATARLLRPHV